MNRRSAVGLVSSWLLAGCGGGEASGVTAEISSGANASGANASDANATGAASPANPVAPAATSTVPQVDSPSPAAPENSPAADRPTAPKPLSSNIAVWGDSITNMTVDSLAALFPSRQVFNGGVSGQTSMQIAARMTASTAHKTWITVFWYGHNNYTKDPVKADIAASVATLANENSAFVVLSMLSWADASGLRGTSGYDTIMRVNRELAAAYPNNFLDIRSHLVSLYNRSDAQDVRDFQNDVTPSSLRYDTIHPNETGRKAIALKIQQFILSKGW